MLLASALGLGFLHGLGADHLMAIAALSLHGAAGPAAAGAAAPRARAFGVAVRFAVGHALLLGLGGALMLVLGWSLPVMFERAGEVLGGLLLVVLGGVALWGVLSGRVYGHSHRHGDEPAAHWHLHVGSRDAHPAASRHSHLPTIIGAAFALSSLRALITLAPFGSSAEAASLVMLLVVIAVFAVGILLSMSLFGVAFARFMSAAVAARLGHAATIAMAIASVGLGIFWVVRA